MALNAKATQEFVPIKEVRDGIAILKDGSIRAILMVSSVNLALKSADEQRATLAQFQNFLNSLDFPIQICVQSRRYDVRPYLLSLDERMKAQLEPLLKIQTREYIEFIRTFTEQINIMTKTFFVVIPYSGVSVISQNALLQSFLPKRREPNKAGQTDEMAEFEERHNQLDQRISVVQSGLNRCGLRSTELGTYEIVELFYKTFNPGDAGQGMKLGEKNI